MDIVAIIGGGPAGLMSAEAAVTVGARLKLYDPLYDPMSSVGRKLLPVGEGGLGLIHSVWSIVDGRDARSGSHDWWLSHYGLPRNGTRRRSRSGRVGHAQVGLSHCKKCSF